MSRTKVTPRGEFFLTFRDRRGARQWDLFFPNGVTDDGVDHFADAAFRGGGRFASWYVGLIDGSGFSALDPLDTHDGHPGWTEFTLLASSNRGLWVPGPASGGLVAPSSPTVLNVTGAGSVRGAFLASRQPVGPAAGAVLYATGAAGAGLPVSAGGTVTINYSVRYAPRG